MSDFDDLLQAREDHFAIEGEHELWIIRTLDGLAIGLDCKPCEWDYWRAGYEHDSRYSRADAPADGAPTKV